MHRTIPIFGRFTQTKTSITEQIGPYLFSIKRPLHPSSPEELCNDYPGPNGYYFECVDKSNSQFSCRSTCGPSLNSIGTGPEFDLLNTGGGNLLLGKKNKDSLFDFSNFRNGKSRHRHGSISYPTIAGRLLLFSTYDAPSHKTWREIFTTMHNFGKKNNWYLILKSLF